MGSRSRGRFRSRTGPCGGSGSWAVRDALRQLRTTALSLPSKSVSALVRKTDDAVRDGEYPCGIPRFETKRFDEARLTLTDFAATHEKDESRARAQARASPSLPISPAPGRRSPGAAGDGRGGVPARGGG